jgi:hypothetical protein
MDITNAYIGRDIQVPVQVRQRGARLGLITIQKMKISSTSKTCDMSDLIYS